MIRTVTSTEFTRNVGRVLEDIRFDGEPVRVTTYGRRPVVIIPEEDHARLLAIEEEWRQQCERKETA